MLDREKQMLTTHHVAEPCDGACRLSGTTDFMPPQRSAMCELNDAYASPPLQVRKFC